MERYLYFTDSAADGGADLALYPTSAVTIMIAQSATVTAVQFVPRDGVVATEDNIELTHAEGDHKAVMSDLVAIINAERNRSPFAVVCDAANGVFNLGSVSSLAITSAD
jgi:hypothetical protein